MSQVNMGNSSRDLTIHEINTQSPQTFNMPTGSDPLPPAKDGTANSGNMELPTLTKPKLSAGNSSIALDILLDAIGAKQRQTEVHAGLAEVKANAAERAQANKEKLAKIDEQIEKLENKSIWDKIGDVFKYIGMALAAVACVAMIATGVGAGIGAVGLTLLAVSVADSVLDAVGEAVTGRGWGLTSLVGWAVEAISGSEEAGMWTKLGLDIALSIATICATCGAGAGSAASNMDKIQKVAHIVSKIATVTQATTGVLGAGATVASAVYGYDAAKAQADQKRFEAILENINMLNDTTTQHLKRVLEQSEKINETVNEIVQENNAAQAAILTDGAASMA